MEFGKDKNSDLFESGQNDNTDENNEQQSISTAGKIISILCKIGRNIRHSCTKMFDSSITAALLDSIYYKALSCPVKVAAIFLLSFSIVALVIGAIINGNDISAFIFNINTYEQIIAFILSLILLTSNKNVGELLSSGRILSSLSIVYSQSGILAANAVGGSYAGGYSTAFFLGILVGLSSFLQPISNVVLFIVSLLCVIFIFNRPECGFLIILAILPIFSTKSIIVFSILTFAALVYKFARGKRHINIGFAQVLLIISAIYLYTKCKYTLSGNVSYEVANNFLIVALVSITTVNLVRSTSMLYKFIKLILSISRIYSLAILIYYVMCTIFRRPAVDAFILNTPFSGLFEALTDNLFISTMIILLCPLNLALCLGSSKTSQRVHSLLCCITLFLASIFVADYGFMLVITLSCIIVCSFFYKKLILLLLISPLISMIFMNTYNLIPDSFKIDAYANNSVVNISLHRSGVIDTIQDNLMTGIGFGMENISSVLNAGSPIRFNSAALSLLLSSGVIGLLLISTTIAIMLYKCGKAIAETNMISLKAKALSVGLFTSSLSYVLLSIVSNTFLNMRTSILFAIIISLGYATKRCVDADYIEPGRVRNS